MSGRVGTGGLSVYSVPFVDADVGGGEVVYLLRRPVRPQRHPTGATGVQSVCERTTHRKGCRPWDRSQTFRRRVQGRRGLVPPAVPYVPLKRVTSRPGVGGPTTLPWDTRTTTGHSAPGDQDRPEPRHQEARPAQTVRSPPRTHAPCRRKCPRSRAPRPSRRQRGREPGAVYGLRPRPLPSPFTAPHVPSPGLTLTCPCVPPRP